MLATAEGTSIATENVFESRFLYVDELRRMGADIRTEGHHAVIRGVERLSAAPVRALDIRAGAAMTIAALTADGVTEISELHHLDRGYEGFVAKLRRARGDRAANRRAGVSGSRRRVTTSRCPPAAPAASGPAAPGAPSLPRCTAPVDEGTLARRPAEGHVAVVACARRLRRHQLRHRAGAGRRARSSRSPTSTSLPAPPTRACSDSRS